MVDRYVRSLLNEAALLSIARHRNLLNFFGISMGRFGRLLIVTELCQGTLRQHLAAHPLPKGTSAGSQPEFAHGIRLRACIELAQALECAMPDLTCLLSPTSNVVPNLCPLHELVFESALRRLAHLFCTTDLHRAVNVVHRDVKLDNIFVSFKGRVKLGDLGTAVLISGLGEAKVAGTPLYLAPEALDSSGLVEPGYGDRLDIFAAAVTMCEIFTSSTPYQELLHRFKRVQDL